jgi:hypothetical protein
MTMAKPMLLIRNLAIALALQFAGSTFAVTVIEQNDPVHISAAQGAQLRYKLWVPASKKQVSIKISGSGSDGDADLYVRRGTMPTTTNWDFRPFLSGNTERVFINNPAPSGTWYHIMVHAFEAISDITLLAQFQNEARLDDNGGIVKNRADPMESGYSHFHIDVPPGATKLIIKTSGGTGDADLYVNLAVPADEERWDYRPFKIGNNEAVNVHNPAAGTWWAMIHAFEPYAGVRVFAEYEGLPKYRMSSLGNSDKGNGVNFTRSPGTSWRYGHWGGPVWTNAREQRVSVWNGAFDAAPVDAMDNRFREHDLAVRNANGANSAIIAANQQLLNKLNNLPNGANGSNHAVWGQIYVSLPSGAPASVTVQPGSPIALPQIIAQPTPMPFSEYARRQAKLGLNDEWFTE